MKGFQIIVIFLNIFKFCLSQQVGDLSKSFSCSNCQNTFSIQHRTENFFLWEDFEHGLFPPPGWSIVQHNPKQTWKQATSLIMPPISGQYFVICRYDDTYNIVGQDEKLYTSILNLSGLEDAKLTFWFVFSKYWGIKPHNNYDLQIIVSTDGGNNFTDTIWTELSTDTSKWDSWEWVYAEADLTPYIGQTQFQLCFRYVGFDGADAALDDIAISYITTNGKAEQYKIALYPNPVNDILRIETNEIFTNLKVFTINGYELINLKNHNNLIDVSHLESGFYLLKVRYYNGQIETLKFQKLK